jgi:hypothetical protein
MGRPAVYVRPAFPYSHSIKGAHPVDLTAKKLIRRTASPLDWRMQKQTLGFR